MNKSENALTGSLHLSAERLDPQAILFNRRNGDPGKTRTSDTQFRKLLLYPPELRGHVYNEYFVGVLHFRRVTVGHRVIH